ncbi:uncharacterized protein TrAtP1_012777 [Trichoderma atroviride]|uniref:uncharacterized protein n=1 Tax=Hypocrea atroviridis TaxID=63577 RepID=UPI00331BCD08|nr:hypothetical protein TrAtP1_012777 [Trichoderma atroviride]
MLAFNGCMEHRALQVELLGRVQRPLQKGNLAIAMRYQGWSLDCISRVSAPWIIPSDGVLLQSDSRGFAGKADVSYGQWRMFVSGNSSSSNVSLSRLYLIRPAQQPK